MSKRKFNVYYQERLPLSFSCDTVSMTEQCFLDECDINNIVRKPNLGVNPFSPQSSLQASFGDFSDLKSFEESNRIVAQAHNDFMRLPSHIRDRFDNSIQKFADFINDDLNIEEGISLGIYENNEHNLKIVSSLKETLQKVENPARSGVSAISPETSAQPILDVNGRTDTIQ